MTNQAHELSLARCSQYRRRIFRMSSIPQGFPSFVCTYHDGTRHLSDKYSEGREKEIDLFAGTVTAPRPYYGSDRILPTCSCYLASPGNLA